MAVMVGTGSANNMNGSAGNDVMYGEGGKDAIQGGVGDDRLHGGGNNDTIDGAVGDDVMFGASNVGGRVDMNKFTIAEDVTGRVTFQGESAGYQNALGMYKIGKDGTVYGVEILFANASLKGSGGDLVAGKSFVDVDLKAGEKVGFFVVPNAYAQSNMSKLLNDTKGTFKLVGADGKAANVADAGEMKLVHTSSKGVDTLVKSEYGNSLFTSIDAKNGDKYGHVVGDVDTTAGSVKIGFEDLWKGGDKDFDDSVFTFDIGQTNAALLARAETKAATTTDDDVMTGGAGNDKMFGMKGNDHMDGGDGADKMWGNSGEDVLIGGDGNDQLFGGKDNDLLMDGVGDDVARGDSGNDRILAGEGNDRYIGGSGIDTIDATNATGKVSIDLHAKSMVGLGTDSLNGIENAVGGNFDDMLKGDKRANVLDGGAGDDWFRGLGGADTLIGGQGADTFTWLAKDLAGGVDHIADFELGVDKLDLHDLLKGQSFANLADVMKATDVAGGTNVAVKIGGAFVDVVVLDNITASDLLKDGLILA